MRHRSIRAGSIIGLLCAALAATAAHAYDGLVEKKVFTIPTFTTVGGKTIRNVRIGYETYGTLNAAGTNAIFVAHYFSGNSHAAGKYKATDAAPGYWDSVIGAGKPFDTDKYFVVSADTLVNLSTKDPNVVTTGPATIDPDTGKPYGMRFPIVTIKDFVEHAEGARRRARHQALRGRDRRVDGLAAGDGMGVVVSRHGRARDPGHPRRARGEPVPDRGRRRMGDADLRRSEVERRRLLRPRGAAARRRPRR